MSLSRDVVLKLIGDADSAKRALNEAANAAGVTVREYRRAETLQRQQAAQQKRLAAEQRAAAEDVGSSMLKMGAVVALGLGAAVKAAVDWESSWAGVKKVLKDEGNFAMVESQLRALASVLPVTHGEIAKVAAAAAQLGVEDRNVAAFTKTMIMLGTTTNLSAEQAATSLARFSNIMGTSQSDADRLGSAIVWLGNSFATTESEIVDMAMRLAGAGRQVGMTEADVLALAASLSSVGIEAEAGGSAISKVMIEIAQSVSEGGDQLDRFAKVAGMSAEAFASQWKSSPAKALDAFVQGLGRMQKAGGDVFGTLEALGMTEVRMRDALLRSAAAGDVLSKALSGANDAFAENNALQQEAQQRYDTAASKLALFRNSIVEAGISVGGMLLPALTAVVEGVTSVVDGFNALPAPIKAVIVGLGLLVGASALFSGGMLMMKGKVDDFRASLATLKSADGFFGKLGSLAGMLGPVAGILGVVVAGISLFSAVLSAGGSKVATYEGHVQSLTDAFRESNGAIDENVRKMAAQSIVATELDSTFLMFSSNYGKLTDALKAANVPLDLATDALLGNKDAYDQVIAALDEYIAANDKGGFQDNVAAANMAKDAIEDLAAGSSQAAKDAKDLQEASQGSADGIAGQGDAAAGAAGGMDDYGSAAAAAADASADLEKAVDALKKAFDALNGINVDTIKAQTDMVLALDGMSKAIEQNGTSLDTSTAAGAKNAQMLLDLAKKAEDVVTATYQSTGSLEAARAAYDAQRQSILDNAAALGFNADQVAALLDQIFQMPAEMTTTVSTPGASDALVQLETLKAVAYEASNGTYQVKVDALTADAESALNQVGLTATQMPDGTFLITAQTAAAQEALDSVVAKSNLVDAQNPTVSTSAPGAQQTNWFLDAVTKAAQTADAQSPTVSTSAPGAAQSNIALDAVTKAAQATDAQSPTVNTSAPGATQATGQLQGTTNAANAIPPSKTITVKADTYSAEQKLAAFKGLVNSITGKTVNVHTSYTSSGTPMAPQADGGQVKFYGSGGEHHTAQYARAGTWRVWAEPETGGEWYLPDGLHKRERSVGLAEQMLASWGYAMLSFRQLEGLGQPSTQTVVVQPPMTRADGGTVVQVTGVGLAEVAQAVADKLDERRFLTGGGR